MASIESWQVEQGVRPRATDPADTIQWMDYNTVTTAPQMYDATYRTLEAKGWLVDCIEEELANEHQIRKLVNLPVSGRILVFISSESSGSTPYRYDSLGLSTDGVPTYEPTLYTDHSEIVGVEVELYDTEGQ